MRLINRLLAALLSLALIGVGVLVIIEVAAFRLNHKPALVHWHSSYSWARRTTWTQGSVRGVCIALAAVGLVLLLAELKRARVSRLKIEAGDTDAAPIDTAYTRSGAATAIRSAVTDVDGIRRAKVTVKRRKVHIAASASARDKAAARSLSEPVTAAAQERLSALQLQSTPKVSVRVTPRSN